jgi:coproporphyrinogen III oxidase-like Fe-S oxidoreductase
MKQLQGCLEDHRSTIGKVAMNNLLHSPFDHVAKNTIDYWMKPDAASLTNSDVVSAIKAAKWGDRSTLQLYLHIPYCAQRCTFCAFSGGNSLDFKTAQKYTDLLIWQMNELLKSTQAYGKPVMSVNIGGGSPDLIKGEMSRLLKSIRQLPGVSQSTEISVEFTLSTVTADFIDALIEYEVTKASFGVQVIDPKIRKYLRMPSQLRDMEETVRKLHGKVPIINADLMTGFPAQTIESVISDLLFFIDHECINSISSYLLTQGAAPALLGDIKSGAIADAVPEQYLQALFRLHTYTTLLRAGWIRKGTNTYMNPRKINANCLDNVAGNECIGARRHGDFLVGVGAQAISSLPGVRVENTVDIEEWMRSAEKGEHSFALEKCSLDHQQDMALWVFPLMYNGLLVDEYEELKSICAIDQHQVSTFESYVKEGLIVRFGDRYLLSITGEVFMGHLVRSLKKPADQKVIDEYVNEGHVLGELLAQNKVKNSNSVNNRQIFKIFAEQSADSRVEEEQS